MLFYCLLVCVYEKKLGQFWSTQNCPEIRIGDFSRRQPTADADGGRRLKSPIRLLELETHGEREAHFNGVAVGFTGRPARHVFDDAFGFFAATATNVFHGSNI